MDGELKEVIIEWRDARLAIFSMSLEEQAKQAAPKFDRIDAWARLGRAESKLFALAKAIPDAG